MMTAYITSIFSPQTFQYHRSYFIAVYIAISIKWIAIFDDKKLRKRENMRFLGSFEIAVHKSSIRNLSKWKFLISSSLLSPSSVKVFT